MQVKVDEWTEAAFEASVEEFLTLIEEAKGVLEAEKESRAQSGLIRISPRAVKNVVVVGDLHGDMESLVHILKDIEDLNADRIVFLGDYGDRGSESVEVYYVLLKLKVSEGKGKEKEKKIIMLRGNHEGPPDMPVMPHDLPFLFTAKYGVRGKEVYEKLKELWEYLPYAVLVEGRYLMLHGGLPVNVDSIEDIAFAHDSHPASSNFEEILWSDPVEGKGDFPSTRGAGRMFGKDVTERGLRVVGVKTLIRSHEPCEGVEVKQGGKVLTLFSRKGAPYFNTQAAYLVLDENALMEAKDAEELARSAARIW
ncbi:MAG TPA: serine/threonine protein phosphatase [Methanophagales archaeon]|nr:serine/threonine protein phosphatase [Methanophagales archaeon]